MAFTCFENFDSYPDGSIANRSGGDGWAGNWIVGAGTWNIEGTLSQAGAKAVQAVISEGGTSQSIYRTFANINAGVVSVYVRKSSATGANAQVQLLESTTSRAYIEFTDAGNIIAFDYNSGSPRYVTLLVGYQANTWYKVSIEIDKANQNNLFRAQIDNGAWSSWLQVSGGSYTNINRLQLSGDHSAGTITFDSISPAPAPAPIVVDSYGEYNYAATTTLNGGSAVVSYGQTFTAGISGKLDSGKFYAFKTSGATGDMYAKLWSISGTHGTDGVPDTLLGTSDALDASTLGTSIGIVTFSFSGANRADITAGTNYVITLDYSGATSIFVARDNSSPSHPGNSVSKVWNSGSYGYNTANDVIFYAYGVTSVAYTLAAAYTTFTETAYAALLKLGWKMAAAYSSFSLTGQSSVFGWGRKIAAAVGTFALTGFNTVLFKGKQLVAEVVNFALTGQDSAFHRGINLITEAGFYALTGVAAVLRMGKKLIADAASLALTGKDIAFSIGKGFAADVAEFVLTGQDATIQAGKRMVAAAASVAMTGYPVRWIVNGFRILLANRAKTSTNLTNRAKVSTDLTNREKQ